MTRSVSVITGGAGGMGVAAGKILGRDHSIVIADVDQNALDAAAAQLHANGISCTTVVCDVTDVESVSRLVGAATSLGTVKSVVHTAGLSPSMAAHERVIRVNALGTVHVNEAFYEIARPGFAIVNVASVAASVLPGLFIPTRGFEVALRDEDAFMKRMTAFCKIIPMGYALSKSFVTWYCASQAKRFGQRGARLVSVSPGSIDTAMGRLEEDAGSGAMVTFAALKRLGRPEEVAELLAFCASDKASYLTGVDIPCDGGVLATLRIRDVLTLAQFALFRRRSEKGSVS
ncbi:MAG: SDR family oxidoreductase [Actinomycetota bacterium]